MKTIEALNLLTTSPNLTNEQLSLLESFVCTVYNPKGINIQKLPELRWHLFCKSMCEGDRLPPTIPALKQHIMRAHVQAYTWGQAHISQQKLLDPLQHGFYKEDNGRFMPVTTDALPAPKAIIELVRCNCKTNCTSARCSCKMNDLPCTELCCCSTERCRNDTDIQAVIRPEDPEDNEYD